MIKIKNEQLFLIDKAAMDLLKYAMPAQTSLKIRKALKPLQVELREVQEEYQRLSDRYAKKRPDGSIDYREGTQVPIYEDTEGFEEEYRSIMDMETEFAQFPVDGIKVVENIRSSVLIQLGKFLSGNTNIDGEKVAIRTGDISPVSRGLDMLAAREVPFKKAVKLWRIFQQLLAASEKATQERKDLVELYAIRNEAGEMVYLDKAAERVDVEDSFYDEEKRFLDTPLELEGIPLAWFEEIEKQHGNLPGEIASLLGDLIVLPPDQEPEQPSNGGVTVKDYRGNDEQS